MTDGILDFMGFGPHELRLSATAAEAVSKWLRHRHPANTAKKVAKDTGADPRTAENMIAGHLSAATFTRLLRAYGWPFLAAIGAAVIGESYEDSIHREIGAIANERRDLEEREARLRGAYARVRVRGTVDAGHLRLVPEKDPDARREVGR